MIEMFFHSVRTFFVTRVELTAENALLRYQLLILKRRKGRRFQLRRWDRPILIIFSKLIKNWKSLVLIVQPETLVNWHRKGFALYWKFKFTRRRGRPAVARGIIKLIREISRANPLWGAPRIHGELKKLGIDVSQATVEKYMVENKRTPPQDWKTFLANHSKEIVAIDFFVVPTIRFRMLWSLVVLSHDRREILYTAVTHNPSPSWTLQQLRNAFPFDELPRFILRDRDVHLKSVKHLGVDEIVTAYRSPWQNGYVERVIGSIRRECTDHLIVFGERHLQRILNSYQDYYNRSRTHLGLNKDSPISRQVRRKGIIKLVPKVGGLHHEFTRMAA